MSGKLTAAEQAHVDHAADQIMRFKVRNLPELLDPPACACIGGIEPGGPCFCRLWQLGVKAALARCGLRPKPWNQRSRPFSTHQARDCHSGCRATG